MFHCVTTPSLKSTRPGFLTDVGGPSLGVLLSLSLLLMDCVLCISVSAVLTLLAERTVRSIATGRTRDAAAAADPNSYPPDLPADETMTLTMLTKVEICQR